MRYIATVLVLALAGCQSAGTVKYLSRPGASQAHKQAAVDECKIASFREIPQNLATETTGGYYNPGTVQCSTIGTFTNCYRVGQVNIPATSQTYDVNEDLRQRYIERCVQVMGFSITELPLCGGAEARQAALKAEAEGRLPACAPGPRLD